MFKAKYIVYKHDDSNITNKSLIYKLHKNN